HCLPCCLGVGFLSLGIREEEQYQVSALDDCQLCSHVVVVFALNVCLACCIQACHSLPRDGNLRWLPFQPIFVADTWDHRCCGLESVCLAFQDVVRTAAEGRRRSRRLGRGNGDPPCAVHLPIRTPHHKQHIANRLGARLRAVPLGQNFPIGRKLDGELEEVICVDSSVDRSVTLLF